MEKFGKIRKTFGKTQNSRKFELKTRTNLEFQKILVEKVGIPVNSSLVP